MPHMFKMLGTIIAFLAGVKVVDAVANRIEGIPQQKVKLLECIRGETNAEIRRDLIAQLAAL